MGIISVVMIVPFLWLMSSSFKSATEIIRIPPTIFPQKPILTTYRLIFEKMNFGRYFFNSGVISTCITFITLFAGSLAGYVFAKFDFYGKEILFMLILSSMMIPFVVIVLPLFLMMSSLGWHNTYMGLIVPVCISTFGIFLMRNFIHEIPDDLIDAAKIDGGSNWWVYVQIILPLSKAALGALAVFQFMWAWNGLLWPLLVAATPDMRTLPLALTILQWEHQGIRYDVVVTGAAISVLPVMVIFGFFQRYLIKGVAMTGIKF